VELDTRSAELDASDIAAGYSEILCFEALPGEIHGPGKSDEGVRTEDDFDNVAYEIDLADGEDIKLQEALDNLGTEGPTYRGRGSGGICVRKSNQCPGRGNPKGNRADGSGSRDDCTNHYREQVIDSGSSCSIHSIFKSCQACG